jgi:hypothetical protein
MSVSSRLGPWKRPDCAHVVLNSTTLQVISVYSGQSSHFEKTLAGVGLSEPE